MRLLLIFSLSYAGLPMVLGVALLLPSCSPHHPHPIQAATNGGNVLAPSAIACGFFQRSIVLHGQTYGYSIYVPPHYTPQKRWPIILFLHGSGACGTDGTMPTEGALGESLGEHPDWYPCLVVFPQSRNMDYWTGEMERLALAALDATSQEFHADLTRIYLTGYSMGGSGTWFLAARHPGRFAAIAPVCGRVAVQPSRAHAPDLQRWLRRGSPYRNIAGRMGETPVWVFHGGADPVVPVTESRNMVAILKANGADVHYTEYAKVGHDAWSFAYDEPALSRWLFSHRLPHL